MADAVFGEDNSARPKIALQFFIYDMLLRRNGFTGPVCNSVYQTSRIFREPVEVVPLDGKFYSMMEARLAGLLDEIADTDVPFRRADDPKTCSYCDFRKICGK